LFSFGFRCFGCERQNCYYFLFFLIISPPADQNVKLQFNYLYVFSTPKTQPSPDSRPDFGSLNLQKLKSETETGALKWKLKQKHSTTTVELQTVKCNKCNTLSLYLATDFLA